MQTGCFSPFQSPVQKEQRDPKLLESLKAERSGILYRAILEYRELVENGMSLAGDDVISFQSQCVERGVIPPDGVAEFVSACCIMDAEHFTSTEQLHLAYLDFCREHHLPSLNDRGAFSRQFSAAVGFAAKREKQQRERCADEWLSGCDVGWGCRIMCGMESLEKLPLFMTVHEASEVLRIGRSKTYELVRSGG